MFFPILHARNLNLFAGFLKRPAKKFSVAILGLGGIGMGYDRNLPANSYILTHARAFHLHPGLELVGGCDLSAKKRDEFQRIYRKPAYASATRLLNEKKPEVVVVAAPTPAHRKVVTTILKSGKCRAILCEKPLTMSRAESDAVVRVCREKKISLFVNFIRRADPAVLEVKRRIDTGCLRGPFKAVVWYGKGLLHTGSHFLDLLYFWLGPVRESARISNGRSLASGDGEPDCRFVFEKGNAVFLAAGDGHVSSGTVEMICRNGRLTVDKNGTIQWQPWVRRQEGRDSQSCGEIIFGDMRRYQARVAEQLHHALLGKKNCLCTGAQALACQIHIHESLRHVA